MGAVRSYLNLELAIFGLGQIGDVLPEEGSAKVGAEENSFHGRLSIGTRIFVGSNANHLFCAETIDPRAESDIDFAMSDGRSGVAPLGFGARRKGAA